MGSGVHRSSYPIGTASAFRRARGVGELQQPRCEADDVHLVPTFRVVEQWRYTFIPLLSS
jgi:hypothetical protein